jgi:hypothetical protein
MTIAIIIFVIFIWKNIEQEKYFKTLKQ